MNLSSRRKFAIALVLSLASFCVTFTSSIYSAAIVPIALKFDVSTEVSTLGVSLYILVRTCSSIMFVCR
jgi:DHA1 family multidrug resistance protein-like MFS transporter